MKQVLLGSLDFTKFHNCDDFIEFKIVNFFQKVSLLLGFEVDKPSKILIKTLNVKKYIKSDIQTMEAPRTKDPII